MSPKIVFREGTEKDSSFIFNKIIELARYMDTEYMVTLTETEFAKEFTGGNNFVGVLIADTDEPDSKFVGYAVYFPFFSSFTGKRLFLEDIYIEEEFRGNGFGKAFFRELTKIGLKRGCNSIEWTTLPDNDVAVGFYKSLGAIDKTVSENWHAYYLPKDVFMKLANS